MFLYEIHYYKFGQKETVYAYGKTTVEEERYWMLLDDKKNSVVVLKARDFVAAIKLKDTIREVMGEHELTKNISKNVRSIKSKSGPNRKVSRQD